MSALDAKRSFGHFTRTKSTATSAVMGRTNMTDRTAVMLFLTEVICEACKGNGVQDTSECEMGICTPCENCGGMGTYELL